MINMVQEFEAMMAEEEDAGDLDAKDQEEFEIEVLFDFTKLGNQDSSGQDEMVNKEDNEVFSINNALVMIE